MRWTEQCKWKNSSTPQWRCVTGSVLEFGRKCRPASEHPKCKLRSYENCWNKSL